MMELMRPFTRMLDMTSGVLQPADIIVRRYLSDMVGMYSDAEAERQILDQEGDRLIYEVYGTDLPEGRDLVHFCTTIIYPGRIGDEYHMTKGHFHAQRERSELYLGIGGVGQLLLQTENGVVESVVMRTGTIAYVPPKWAHRTANVGIEPFRFFAAWIGDAGHDYAAIEKSGFAELLVERNGEPVLMANPKYSD
jgi:glucose-6-phosphate isomerase